MRCASRFLLLTGLAAGSGCAETTAPLPPPTEFLIVVNTGNATLSLVPLAPDRSSTSIPLGTAVPADARPAAGREFVVTAAGSGDSLAVVGLRSRALERMVALGPGAGARGVALQGDTMAVAALSGTGRVARVDLRTGETVVAEVGGTPKDVIFTRGRLFVVNANLSPCGAAAGECPDGPGWITVLDPGSLGRATGGPDSIPLPGPGNAAYAAIGADGRLYVLSVGGGEDPAGRLSIVDPVTRTEVGSFGGLGEAPGPIAADRGERILISSRTEGLMEFNTRTRTVVRGAGTGIPLIGNAGVTTDSRNVIYGIEAGTCGPGSSAPGRARVFRTDFTEVRTIGLGLCPGGAATTLIPPDEEPASR